MPEKYDKLLVKKSFERGVLCRILRFTVSSGLPPLRE